MFIPLVFLSTFHIIHTKLNIIYKLNLSVHGYEDWIIILQVICRLTSKMMTISLP